MASTTIAATRQAAAIGEVQTGRATWPTCGPASPTRMRTSSMAITERENEALGGRGPGASEAMAVEPVGFGGERPAMRQLAPRAARHVDGEHRGGDRAPDGDERAIGIDDPAQDAR